MSSAWGIGTGLTAAGLGAFLLSLIHVSLNSFSKISFSGLLEDKDKEFRQRILDRFDDIRIAVETLRTLFLLVAGVLLVVILSRVPLRPLVLFPASLAGYLLVMEYGPRLLNSLNKDAILTFFLPALGPLEKLASPLTFVSRRLDRREEKEAKTEPRETSEEEIETFLDEAREEGIIEKEEEGLLRGVVEFGDTVVREIMTPRVDIVCIRKDATIGKLRELIIKEKYSRIPVTKDRIDNIEGIVIAKDLLEYGDPEHENRSIEDLVRPVIFVPESMDVSALLKEFKRVKVKLAVVVDEHGGVSGLVTMEDLVEEIVGEIQDEYDMEESRVVETGPRDYRVSGEVEVEELEDLFDLDLAEDDFITAGGFITHHLGRLPCKGEVLTLKGLSIEILDVDQKRIKTLRVRRLPESRP